MAERERSEGRARLFVALELPGEVRSGIESWARAAAADRDELRPVRPEALHLTLVFLGDRDPAERERIGALVAALEPRPVAIGLEREPLPLPRRRPGLFAISAPSPAASELQSELSAALVEAGLHEPERRAFWPHVTALRIRGGGRRRGRGRRVEPPPPLPEPLAHAFGAVRVALYRSELRPEGSSYTRLVDVELPQRG